MNETIAGAASPEQNATKPRIQTAVRTIDVLLAVARASSSGISAKELSIQLGLPRQVVYHLIHTLVSTNMLRQAGGKSYVLGLGVANIAHGYKRQSGAPDYLTRYAERAAAETGETAYVVGWVDTEIVVLATARSSSAIHAAEPPPGTAGDAHARASGKLLLAMSTQEEAENYLARSPLSARTRNTLTSRTTIVQEFGRIRQDWIAVEREEYAAGLACMAVPIGRPPTRLVLGISAPIERFERNFEANRLKLQKAANL
ncbi:helix-turn-helix domain-containing protein [Sphingobium sp. DEHP117]|uniref:IclR family transcriptional regulator n=1 Tax=Sphingobium sp. DEHP117 TaxID=2993436 RepID=UPI0027D5AD33|nr:IclR family transcriptional regulator C-terminal domain-containing protein [Sphingobium sp. DEHP117]MDQ4420980.1 helix-turn-helix domain-containing protein [Sphingobium sp. DEHP117]